MGEKENRGIPKGRHYVSEDGFADALSRLAGELGSITEACRRSGVDRSAYYRAIRRKNGQEERTRRSPLAKPLDLESRLIALCLEYPDWGCDRLAFYLTLKGESISSPTVQKILIRHGLGRAEQRRAAALRMEEEGVRSGFETP